MSKAKERFMTWIDQKSGGAMLGEVVVAEVYDAAQAELSALREELANLRETNRLFSVAHEDSRQHVIKIESSLTAAEQRNSEIAELLIACRLEFSTSEANAWEIAMREKIDAAVLPTESGASE